VLLIYGVDLIAATVMTLSVLEGHSPIACVFRCDISYLWHIARSSAYAELLVWSSVSGTHHAETFVINIMFMEDRLNGTCSYAYTVGY